MTSSNDSPNQKQQTQQPQPKSVERGDKNTASYAAPQDQEQQCSAEVIAFSDEEQPTIDNARFSAGIVRLYDTILSEPVPDTMLNLITQLAKKERS